MKLKWNFVLTFLLAGSACFSQSARRKTVTVKKITLNLSSHFDSNQQTGIQKTKGNVVHDFYLGIGTGLAYLTATNVEKEGGLTTFSKTTSFSLLPSFHPGWNIGVEKEILKIK